MGLAEVYTGSFPTRTERFDSRREIAHLRRLLAKTLHLSGTSNHFLPCYPRPAEGRE